MTRYIKNKETGVVFVWTEMLAQMPWMEEVDMRDATAIEVDAKEVPDEPKKRTLKVK